MMIPRLHCCVAVLALAMTGQLARADRVMVVPLPARPVQQAIQAQAILLGKIVEIEKDTVEARLHPAAPKDAKVPYKIAVLKIDDPLLGVRGLTQVRVGFLATAPAHVDPALPRTAVGVRSPNLAGNVALRADMEGLFMLAPHHDGDFYVIVMNGAPVIKKELNYDKELAEVKKIALAIDDPVTALKSKDKADRARAVQAILTHYQTNPAGGKVAEQELPAEENKLIVAAIAELPWLPEGGDNSKPSRSGLWGHVHAERAGFKPPKIAGPANYQQQWDAATAEFLKTNGDKIRIIKFVAGK
jgi:hypothetical protein